MMKNSIVFVLLLFLMGACQSKKELASQAAKPNILILLTDQWRAQSVGYAHNPEVIRTPNLDKLASQSANFKWAVSTLPVCTPYKASLQTGQFPLTNGVFMNDVRLDTSATTIAEVLGRHGYQTGLIGKWHLDGQNRCTYIPPGPRMQGYQYWNAINCDHNYRHEAYYLDGDSTRHYWKGIAAIAQAKDAQRYIRDHAHNGRPFYLLLSWSMPHAPYHMAPKKYKKLYNPKHMWLPPNVPRKAVPHSLRHDDGHYQQSVQKNMAGYYANIAVLDAMIGKVLKTLKKEGVWNNTVILFTSDHGDLLGSHGAYGKQQPYDESIRVPMLFHYSGKQAIEKGSYEAMISSPDLMSTLLGLAGINIPKSVEGKDFSGYLHGGKSPKDTVVLIESIHPFASWRRSGGRAYRGIRTPGYTYVRNLKGPWLLFDDQKDPYQMHNLIGNPIYNKLQARLNKLLQQKLNEKGDEFRPGRYYVKKFHYPKLNSSGTVPYVGCAGK